MLILNNYFSNNRRVLFTLLIVNLFASNAYSAQNDKQTVAETIPSTVANLQGQKTLYKDGWFVISSSEKALDYAKTHSVDKSYQALQKLTTSVADRSSEYGEDISGDIQQSGKTIKKLYVSGSKQSKKIFQNTHKLAKDQVAFSSDTASKAWSIFSNGYIYLSERTAESRASLSSVPSDFVNNVGDGFSELGSSLKSFNEKSSLDIKANWVNAFDDAQNEFQKAYIESGEKSNSASGLWTLLGGYANSVWEGLFKPTAKTAWQVTATTVIIAGEAIFLPVASTYILTKNTLMSSGMAVYYSGKTAIEVVSPTIEGGFLASVSLLSAGAVPITYVAGSSVGVINQVATTVGAPVAGVAQGAVTTTADTLKYGALLTYDAVSATTKVFINQVKSGVVLGYNALTAIPSQLLLTSLNTSYFILIDGPKLAIASIQGKVSLESGDSSQTAAFDAGNLPVGTVMNLKDLQQKTDAEIKVITDDPEVINQVIEQLSKDLKK